MGVRFKVFTLAVALFLVNFICTFLAAPLSKSFSIWITDLKCSHNNKYVWNSSCKLVSPSPAVGSNYEILIKKPVKNISMDITIFLERMKKYLLLFHAGEIDACENYSKNQSLIYAEMVRDMIRRSANVELCPLVAGKWIKFANLTPDLRYVPSFLPQVAFKMVLTLKDKKEVVMNADIFGKIVHKETDKRKRRN